MTRTADFPRGEQGYLCAFILQDVKITDAELLFRVTSVANVVC
jgi:hypothetical protein